MEPCVRDTRTWVPSCCEVCDGIFYGVFTYVQLLAIIYHVRDVQNQIRGLINVAGVEQIFTFVCIVNVLGFTAPLFNDAPPLSCFAFLLLLQLLSGFLTQQQLLDDRTED